jgi:hypothetical protein
MTNVTVNQIAHAFDKARLDSLLNRRFFYAPAFELCGGVAGLYDYGPPGSALRRTSSPSGAGTASSRRTCSRSTRRA